MQERRGLDLFDLCRKPRNSPPPVSICLSARHWSSGSNKAAVWLVPSRQKSSNLQHVYERIRIGSGQGFRRPSDSQHWRQIPLFRAKNRRPFTLRVLTSGKAQQAVCNRLLADIPGLPTSGKNAHQWPVEASAPRAPNILGTISF